jgi:phosphatidylglycerophosphate synthase
MSQPTIFPLIRHISVWVTPWLLRSPFSANQVTTASMILGLWAAWALSQGQDLFAALLFLGAYVLDNCDGEVARGKNQCSEFGKRYDSFVDWVIHTAFFIGLGYGVGAERQAEMWIWMGWVAAAGGTINYGIGLYFESKETPSDEPPSAHGCQPQTVLEWAVFMLRELTRADFCFLVLLLALPGWLWFLLPAGAIGAQAYWALQFLEFARRFHV